MRNQRKIPLLTPFEPQRWFVSADEAEAKDGRWRRHRNLALRAAKSRRAQAGRPSLGPTSCPAPGIGEGPFWEGHDVGMLGGLDIGAFLLVLSVGDTAGLFSCRSASFTESEGC